VAEPGLLLDTSALLALAFREAGHEAVLAALDGAAITAVNQAEVVEVATRRGIDPARAAAWATELSIPVLPFTGPMAARAGALLAAHRRAGVSLGDAACLGAAEVLGLPVLTGDRAWTSLGLPLEIRILRP
jgi:PIN domain nuclease of toxin-antitoxin system